MLGPALAWYLCVLLAGALAFGAVRRSGVGTGSAWAISRVVGLVVQGWVAWVAGYLGLTHWWWVGLLVLVALAVWGWRAWQGLSFRPIVEVELMGLGAFLLLAFVRLPSLAVSGTEKPMDLAILATLLRPGTIPPADPWLAGMTLPYYYWGFVPWVLPARVLALAPDVVYNLLVPTLALVSAQVAWALARALGGSRRSGAMAAFLVVFTGTLDGWRQVLSGVSLRVLDLWPGSRQISDTITEFPLFTFSLGDLHPHLLCIPLMLAAIFLARTLASGERPAAVTFGATALLFGAAAAANPWCALPTGCAILLVAVGDEKGLIPPLGTGIAVWARVVAVGVLGWALYIPFWLAFRPPAQGLGLVHDGSRLDQLAVVMAAALLPTVLVVWELAWRLGGIDPVRRQLSRFGWLAGFAAMAVVTRRPALALAGTLCTLISLVVFGGHIRRVRPALALTLVGLVLIAGMEIVYVRDPYGADLYRMNTVFKALSVAFPMLAVGTPVLLGWLRRRRPVVAVVGAVLVLLIGLPHLGALAARALGARPAGWGGLGSMEPGEAACAAFLRSTPPGSVLVEAVGDAYSDAARMSSASGVPALLGWANHEGVWRGGPISAELARRRGVVEALYNASTPEVVRSLAAAAGARYVVVGGLERRSYSALGLESVREAGRVVAEHEGCFVVEVR